MTTADVPVQARPRAGEAIRYLRERRGLTQRQLSLAAGLSPAYVSKVEAGIEPSLHNFARLAMAVGMTPYEAWAVLLMEASAR